MRSAHGVIYQALLAAFLLQPTTASAVGVGQVDTFQDGSVGGWIINGAGIGTPPLAALPKNVAGGGPAGAADRFLQLTALGGAGAGSRLSAINATQWGGDYTAAGVGAIAMDLNNFGMTDLSLRLLFENPTLAPPTDLAFSTVPVVIPANSGWLRAVFPVAASDLTPGLGSAAAALSTATAIRIFHNRAAAFPGPPNGPPPVVAILGVDNVTAVPEPSALASVCLGLAGLLLRRGRKPVRRTADPARTRSSRHAS